MLSCRYCGNEMATTDKRVRYCSDECRASGQAKNQAEAMIRFRSRRKSANTQQNTDIAPTNPTIG